MPVNARRFIRKMRGGAQAHLIEAEDGHYYVVKFRNNPQHRRILVNELVAGILLNYLQISSPDVAIVNLTAEFLAENPDVCLQLGRRKVPVEEGWHFGSRFPGDPETLAVYDFIPDVLLRKVANRRHFPGVLVFDKWAGNADSRQSVFFRANIGEWLPDGKDRPRKTGFVAQMIDHGYIFDGPHWTFGDSPRQGLYVRPAVYEPVRSWDDFQPWLDRVVNFPEEVLDDALKQVPRQWLDGDEEPLEKLFYRLVRRRDRVPSLVEASSHGRVNPFPNWRDR